MPKLIAGTRPEDLPNRREVQDLERRLEKLSLLFRAMWTLIQELTEDDLSRRATEIDPLDGKADGKVSVCPSCNRMVAPRHTRRIYGGCEKLVDTIFETV